MQIIERISESYEDIDEIDIEEWIVPGLLEHYSSKIESLTNYVYQKSVDKNSVELRSFREYAAEELAKGTYYFILSNKHWKDGRDINTYLLACLNHLAQSIKRDHAGDKKISLPVCPACKIFNDKTFLDTSGKLLRCDVCSHRASVLEEGMEKDKNLDNELRLRKVFEVHTRKGYRCADCERFIPDSFLKQYGVSCPYNDCSFFGVKDELEIMAHPLGLTSVQMFSLDAKITDYNESSTLNTSAASYDGPRFNVVSNETANEKIELFNTFVKELEVLSDVIEAQMSKVKRSDSPGRAKQKLFMYQAYKNLMELYPDDMVSYLVHRKHTLGSPIQSRIFQEYIRIIENSLPFTLKRSGKKYEICSLLDPNLKLFLGISEFDANINNNHIIPNNTKEVYIGGRKLRNFGSCYIGLLIDIIDQNTGKSIKDDVDYYTFSQIHMNNNVSINTPVTVKHFRIPSHYEMGGMVYLQRVRRKIVDSVYYKIHGKKRKAGT